MNKVRNQYGKNASLIPFQFKEGPIKDRKDKYAQDLSDGGSGDDYRPLHEPVEEVDIKEMRRLLRFHEPRAHTPDSMKDFIEQTDDVSAEDV